MADPKSAEELALEMFLQEARNTRAFLRSTHKAAVAGDEVMASEWANSAQIHRHNVSTLARIIRAIREERRLSRRGESEHYTSRGEVNGG